MGIFAVLRPHRGRAGGREGLQAIQTVQKEGIPLIRRWSGTMAALLSIPSALTYHKFRGAGPRAPRRASISRAGRPWRSLNLTERLTTRTRNSCKQPIKRQTGCFLVLSTWQSNNKQSATTQQPRGSHQQPHTIPLFLPHDSRSASSSLTLGVSDRSAAGRSWKSPVREETMAAFVQMTNTADLGHGWFSNTAAPRTSV